jgi:hypothetical protein
MVSQVSRRGHTKIRSRTIPIRAGNKAENRQGTRPDDPTIVADARGWGDPLTAGNNSRLATRRANRDPRNNPPRPVAVICTAAPIGFNVRFQLGPTSTAGR